MGDEDLWDEIADMKDDEIKMSNIKESLRDLIIKNL